MAVVVAAGNSEDERAAREAVYDDPLDFEAYEIPLLKKVGFDVGLRYLREK